MPALSKNSKATQTLKVEDATRFRSRSRGDSGAQGQVMCVRSSGSSAGPSNDQASAIVRSSGEKKDDDENPVPIEVLEEGEETCMEVLQTNMILHDIAQIMQLITDRMDAKQKRDQLKAQGQVGGDGEIHVVEEGDADVSSSSYDSQETLILGETRHARRWFVILDALSCVLSWQASTDHVMIQRYQESVYKFFVVDPDPLKWPNSRVVWWGFNSNQFKLAILDAVWLSTVRSRPGTINVWRWRKCKCCCSFSCFEPNWNVCFISMSTHVSVCVCVYILVKFPLHQSKGPDMSC